MNEKKNTPLDAPELRRLAERRLKERNAQADRPPTEPDTLRLIHELHVHQIELEMQRAELISARTQVEAGLEQYTELYDFAPAGYFTLGPDGTIRQVNLTGARLLGVDRANLVKRRFGQFVSMADRKTFSTFLSRVFAGRDLETCEVALQSEEASPASSAGPVNVSPKRYVCIEASAADDGQGCRAIVTDTTDRKRAEEYLRNSA